MILKDHPFYKSCIEGKMTKKPFIAKEYRVDECLELVDTNLYRPFKAHEKGMSTSSPLEMIT